MRVASVGQAVFAATLVAIGGAGVARDDFVDAIWNGAPNGLPGHDALARLCGLLALLCGAGLWWRRSSAIASRALLAGLLLWMVLANGRIILLAPLAEGSWQSWGETAVIVAAAWVLHARFATGLDRRWRGGATGESGLRIARAIFACAMFAFGLSHFFYVDLTAPLIPGWLPGHVGWAYFFGCTYIAAGVGVLAGVYARLAAALSTFQMGLFTLLVWVPTVMRGHATAAQWGELLDSWTLTAGAWVVADSYGGAPWFAFRGRRGPQVANADRTVRSRA